MLADCPKLKALYLNGMCLQKEDLKAIGRLRDLRVLDLTDTSYESSDDAWAALAGLGKLESLSLNGTHVTERQLAEIARLTSLKELLLGQTQVKGKWLKRLAPLKNLRTLDLSSDDELTAEGLADLPAFPQLEALYLWYNEIGNDGLKSLPRLDSLTVLDLSQCKFPGSELRHLGKFPKLQRLNLSSTGVYDGSLKYLRGLKALRFLDVEYTRVTERALDALCRDMPGLKTPTRNNEPSTVCQAWSAPPRRPEVFNWIVVQALVLPNTGGSTVTQVYLGPRSLAGQPFGEPSWISHIWRPSLSDEPFAAHPAIANLARRPDGTWQTDEGWLSFLQCPRGSVGAGDVSFFRERRELVELLGKAARVPESNRIAFLEQTAVQGSDIEAWAATRLLLMDPIDRESENRLLGKLRDDRVPLFRRILIDQVLWSRTDRPWAQSLERMTLLDRWAQGLKSANEAKRLVDDLMGFFLLDRMNTPWPTLPEPKKRAAALIDSVRAIQKNPVVPPETKGMALRAVVPLADGVTRGDAFQFLMNIATGSSPEMRGDADFVLSHFAPFNPSETSQVRALLQATPDKTSWEWLRRSLGDTKKPSGQDRSP